MLTAYERALVALYGRRDAKPDGDTRERTGARMNVNALWAGVLGAVYGAIVYVLVMVRRQPWLGSGIAAVWTALLINLVTADNRSPAWHTARFVVSCVLTAIIAGCYVMDSRAKRGSHSRMPGGGG